MAQEVHTHLKTDTSEKFKKQCTNVNNSILLNQAVIEANNALSHFFIHIVIPTNRNNLDKCITHLSRGALDCYKKALTIFGKALGEHSEEFLELRRDEFLSLGLSATSDSKYEIFTRYRALFDKVFLTWCLSMMKK